MRGVYASYIDYRTSITTLLLTGGDAPPIADAEASPRSGPAPQEVAFDARASAGRRRASAGTSATERRGTGAQVRHRYEQPGVYFPVLTVTDDRGATDAFVAEVVVGDVPGARRLHRPGDESTRTRPRSRAPSTRTTSRRAITSTTA